MWSLALCILACANPSKPWSRKKVSEAADAASSSQPTTTGTKHASTVDALMAWFESSGGKTILKPSYSDINRVGLITKRPAKAGTVLMTYPANLQISPAFFLENPEKYSYPIEYSTYGQWSTTEEPIIVWLAYQDHLGIASSYAPYLAVLPHAYPLHPLNWTDAELHEVDLDKGQLPYTRTEMKKNHAKLLKRLIRKHPSLIPAAFFTFEKYLWGLLTVLSRSFLSLDPMQNSPALNPVFDFVNHIPRTKSPAAVRHRKRQGNQQESIFELVAVRDYEDGEEVGVSYGAYDNSVLLVKYGFVIQNNPHETVPLTVQVGARWWGSGMTNEHGVTSTHLYRNTNPIDLLAVLRITLYDGGINGDSTKEWVNALSGDPVGRVSHELRVVSAAIHMLNSSFVQAHTKLDQLTAAHSKLSDKYEMVYEIRNGKLDVITDNLQFLLDYRKSMVESCTLSPPASVFYFPAPKISKSTTASSAGTKSSAFAS